MERKHLIRLAENRLHLTLEEIPFFPSTWLFFETFMQDLMLTVRDPATSGLSLARKFRHQGELFVGGFAAHGFIFYTVSVLLIWTVSEEPEIVANCEGEALVEQEKKRLLWNATSRCPSAAASVPEYFQTPVKVGGSTMKCSMVLVERWLHWFLTFCGFYFLRPTDKVRRSGASWLGQHSEVKLWCCCSRVNDLKVHDCCMLAHDRRMVRFVLGLGLVTQPRHEYGMDNITPP